MAVAIVSQVCHAHRHKDPDTGVYRVDTSDNEDQQSMEADKFVLSPADRLRLSAGTSFHPGNDREVGWLDFAGSTVRLNETAVDILRRCNGEHTVSQVIDELTALYEGSDEKDIAAAVHAFLQLALNKGWVDLSADLG